MADAFEIEIATPERLLASEKAVRAQIPAKDGYIGMLPDHRFSIAVCGGFLEIHNNVVRVLTDVAENGHEIDVTAAEKALKQAQDAMINPALRVDIASALIAARHAQARIDAARKADNKEE